MNVAAPRTDADGAPRRCAARPPCGNARANSLERARAGDSRWFSVQDDALHGAAAEVADVTRDPLPGPEDPVPQPLAPFRGRRRGPQPAEASTCAGDDRPRGRSACCSTRAQARTGSTWKAQSGQRFSRSEGLGVASWHAFTAGLFSSDPRPPAVRSTPAGCGAVDADRLADAFQVGPSNPLVGLEGRVLLLHRLGDALAAQPERVRSAGPT